MESLSKKGVLYKPCKEESAEIDPDEESKDKDRHVQGDALLVHHIQAAVGYVRRLSTSKKIEKLKIFKNSDGDFATVEDLNDILAHKCLTCNVSLITYYLENDMLYCFYGPTFFQ